MHFGASAGRADARRRNAGDAMTSSRSANTADARPPPRPFGLRPAGPLTALLTPHILAGMLVARALPAGLGACSEVRHLFCHRPLETCLKDSKAQSMDPIRTIQLQLVIPIAAIQNRIGRLQQAAFSAVADRQSEVLPGQEPTGPFPGFQRPARPPEPQK